VGEFGQCVGDLAASDLGKTLSQSLGALAELERKAQETESAQARADQASLLSTADEYARLVNSVRVRSLLSDICAPNTDFGKQDGV
jgi:sorting nexin-1/2